MVPDKPQKVENVHFTWCGYIGFRARCYVKVHFKPGFFNPMVQKFMVEMSRVEKFMVEKLGVEAMG